MTNTCRICTKPVDSPYRVYDERGHVIQGCVAPDHTGHLIAISASAQWHNRPEAKQIRKGLKGA